tara:strand:+ start:426 stop:608 length:183 start_codon:yes stop_codon:yes gene_type:complete
MSYINSQLLGIGFCIADNKPLNEYPDNARIKISFVMGDTNWMDVSNTQLIAIHKILDRGE